MKLLAIDTTQDTGSIAILKDGVLIAETRVEAADGFNRVIFGEIEKLLAAHEWRIDAVDGFASASGPGTFTGVRIGLTLAKGLAETLGRPCVGVSNLAALACSGNSRLRGAIIDARRGAVYAGLFDASGTPVKQECLTPPVPWLAALPEEPVDLIVFGVKNFEALLAAAGRNGDRIVPAPEALAGAVGVIAARQLAAAPDSDPALVDANYIRSSDAELGLGGKPGV